MELLDEHFSEGLINGNLKRDRFKRPNRHLTVPRGQSMYPTGQSVVPTGIVCLIGSADVPDCLTPGQLRVMINWIHKLYPTAFTARLPHYMWQSVLPLPAAQLFTRLYPPVRSLATKVRNWASFWDAHKKLKSQHGLFWSPCLTLD